MRRILNGKLGLTDLILLSAFALSASVLHAAPVVRVADGPMLPPAPWEDLRIADGPMLPPAPWEDLRVADGPMLPPAPWEDLRIG